MRVTTSEIGVFFRALGTQMIEQEGVCAGALLSEEASCEAITNDMTDDADFSGDEELAEAIVSAASEGGAERIGAWINAFGDIDLSA